MKIAVIVKSLQIGGMERAAINLAETFANEGHESHLIYFKNKKRDLHPNEKVNVHLFELEKSLKYTILGYILNLFAKLFNGLVRHSYFYFQGLLLTPIFKYKLKKLESEHGKFDLIIIRGQGTFEMIWPYNDKRLIIQQVNVLRKYKTPLNNFFRRVVFSNKQIVCNAPSVLKELTEDFQISGVAPKSLKMISSPINTSLVIKRSEEYIPDFEHKYIINVGRLEMVKNVSFLIEAYAYAKNHLNLQHKLVIVGGGSLFDELQLQVQSLDLSADVFFTGILKNPYPWIKKADLFAFTSKNEGLPNVLLESLACHTNIVSTRGRGGTLDIMSGELSQNLTEFNTEEFANKMVEVLNHQQTIDFSLHLEKYSPRSVVNEYLQYLKEEQHDI